MDPAARHGEQDDARCKVISRDGIDGTQEVETTVDNLDTTNELLGLLGVRAKGYQENRRTSFTLAGAELEIDEWPMIPADLEIEAQTPAEVLRVAAFLGYDEAQFARRLHYDRPIAASIAVLKSVRSSTVELLRSLTEEEWQRGGTHTESGPYTVETWLAIYAAHAHDHATQISRARSSANANTSSSGGRHVLR